MTVIITVVDKSLATLILDTTDYETKISVHFKSQNPCMKFTMKLKSNDSLPF